MKLSAKDKMLNALKAKSGYNTFTVAQAQRRFGISNVTARIDELRKEGHCIYTNSKRTEEALVQAALRAGYSFNQ